jgi:hypothetical protein
MFSYIILFTDEYRYVIALVFLLAHFTLKFCLKIPAVTPGYHLVINYARRASILLVKCSRMGLSLWFKIQLIGCTSTKDECANLLCFARGPRGDFSTPLFVYDD